MRKFFGPTGSVSRITIESQALKTNMLGDPSARVVDVYIPAGHDGRGLPLLVDLVGFTGSGLSHTNWVGFRENLPERLDRLMGELHTLRELLQSEGARVQREITEYAHLSQSAMQSTKIITESLAKWKSEGAQRARG